MMDFYFWLSLPYVLGLQSDSLTDEITAEKSAIKEIENELSSAKEAMVKLMQAASTAPASDAEVASVLSMCQKLMVSLEERRRNLTVKSVEVSLVAMTRMNANFHQAHELHLAEVRNCLKNCRMVSHRATLELRQVTDDAERVRFEELRAVADKLVARFQALLQKQLDLWKEKQASMVATVTAKRAMSASCEPVLPIEAMKRLCVRYVR